MADITLFGATGNIGRRILDEAVSRGHRVTAVTREPAHLMPDDYGPGVEFMAADVLDPADVARVAAGKDVVVSAIGGGDGPGHQATIRPAAESLVEGLRSLGKGAPRLIVVNGAGSLETAPGFKLWDAPGLPESLLQIMHAHGDALDYLRTVDDIQWTALSPAAAIEPGERTGSYRAALDKLITDTDGKSHISVEDFAVALVDEIDEPKHVGQRFTVAD